MTGRSTGIRTRTVRVLYSTYDMSGTYGTGNVPVPVPSEEFTTRGHSSGQRPARQAVPSSNQETAARCSGCQIAKDVSADFNDFPRRHFTMLVTNL